MSLKEKFGVFVIAEVLTIVIGGGICGLFGMLHNWAWNSFKTWSIPGMIIGGLVGVFLYFNVKWEIDTKTQRQEEQTKGC